MPGNRKPKAVCDGNTPLIPIAANERRRINKTFKKKYDRFRRKHPEVHGKIVGLYHAFDRRRNAIFQCAFQGRDGTSRSVTRATCSLLALTSVTSRPVISR
jgi:hypothetical protein